MPLSPGSTVGPYQILGSLGAGGMGEVYRARDGKLGRDVALKILPDEVRFDSERRARFAREARSLAALNHPNIAQIYGFEDGEPISALIMELVEGEDLSDRIRRGAIPYDEAIAIAKQIGEALLAAHDRSIIHRDLKPGNIKVRDDGTIKVLDFGLAKALDPAVATGDPSAGQLSNSPTITTPAMTLRGEILGTAAYMSPEQAKGRVVDKRADIWAFGCVLYEMLTGRRAFAGEDVSDTLASILKSDVDWNGVPPQARRLIKKCLEKDPRKRLHDIGDAWELIDDHPVAPPSRMAWLPWSLAALFAITAIGAIALRFFTAPASPPSTRFQIGPPQNSDFSAYLVLSPDGRTLAFTAGEPGRASSIWVRDLASLEPRRLAGTEGATSPFWSPDSRFIAFASGTTLNKIDVNGGPPQKIADTATTVGTGAWNRDGVIVIGTRGLGPLFRVAASGGVPVALTALDTTSGEQGHVFPMFLPDQKRFLYLKLAVNVDAQGVYVGSIDTSPAEQEATRLLPITLGPLALTQQGKTTRLLYVRDNTLMSQAFDPERAALSGDPQPIVEHLASSGAFSFFAAQGDTLAYRTGSSVLFNTEQLTWVDRKGAALGKIGDAVPIAGGAVSLSIAPDGRRAALMLLQESPAPDLWLVEFARGLMTRFTFTQGPETAPTWSPDGRRLVFASSPTATSALDLFWKDIDGGQETPMTVKPTPGVPTDWTRDGKFIILARGSDSRSVDLFTVSTAHASVEPLLQTEFSETSGRVSSDGRWLAYASDESGQNEVYVRPFVIGAEGKASVGGKWRVSTAGGVVPRWRRDGKELFYRTLSGDFMAVDVSITGGAIQTALPKRLFPNMAGAHAWDVTADGQRFLISVPLRNTSVRNADLVTVVLNWKSTLPR